MIFRYLLIAIFSGLAVFLFLGNNYKNNSSSISTREKILKNEEEGVINDCIKSENLESIRNSIINDVAYKVEQDLKIRNLNSGYYDVHSISDVYNTIIEFEDIKVSLYNNQGDIKCQLTARVNYMGNDLSKNNLLSIFKNYVRVDYNDPIFYQYSANFFKGLKVNSNNIDDVIIKEDNEFFIESSYYISQVYDIDGNLGVAYDDDFYLARDILAGIVAVDAVKQAEEKRIRSINERINESKRDILKAVDQAIEERDGQKLRELFTEFSKYIENNEDLEISFDIISKAADFGSANAKWVLGSILMGDMFNGDYDKKYSNFDKGFTMLKKLDEEGFGSVYNIERSYDYPRKFQIIKVDSNFDKSKAILLYEKVCQDDYSDSEGACEYLEKYK